MSEVAGTVTATKFRMQDHHWPGASGQLPSMAAEMFLVDWGEQVHSAAEYEIRQKDVCRIDTSSSSRVLILPTPSG